MAPPSTATRGDDSGAAMPTDDELMRRCAEGSEAASTELFTRYRQTVWAFFRRRLDDPGRAEDLAQETFVALLQAARRYEARSAFRSYLFGIAFRLLLAERRRQAGRPDQSPSLDRNLPAIDQSVENGIWIRQALGQLEPCAREIVMLREFEQLSYAEIADLLEIPVNTVRSRLFRARMDLRTLLTTAAPSRGTP